MHPKGIMLWSRETISVFYKRCKEDIVYLDAKECIIKKSKEASAPFYVYEIVVRNKKGASPSQWQLKSLASKPQPLLYIYISSIAGFPLHSEMRKIEIAQ